MSTDVAEFIAELRKELAAAVADRLDTRPLLTIEQAGERLGLKSRAVYSLIYSGEIEAISVGTGASSRRILPASIDQYIDRRRVAADEPTPSQGARRANLERAREAGRVDAEESPRR